MKWVDSAASRLRQRQNRTFATRASAAAGGSSAAAAAAAAVALGGGGGGRGGGRSRKRSRRRGEFRSSFWGAMMVSVANLYRAQDQVPSKRKLPVFYAILEAFIFHLLDSAPAGVA